MESKGHDSAGGYIFPADFLSVMNRHIADEFERDLLRAMAGPFGMPTDEMKRRAREIRERIVIEGRLMEVLEAMAPEPCPTCGEVPR